MKKSAIVTSPARQISFELLKKIESGRVFSDDALHSEVMRTADARDRNLITEIVYGTLRRKLLLDHILSGASSRAWKNVDSDAKILLRMSLYQSWFMDRVPDHALVNDAVELAKRNIPGNAFRYLNGVLRHLARSHPWEKGSSILQAPGWVRVSLPQWLWQRWKRRFGEEIAAQYSESLNTPPKSAFRFSKTRGSDTVPPGLIPSDLVPGAYFQNSPVEAGPQDFSSDLRAQDEASQLVPHLLGNVRGELIWDACAAPGGKTSILCANTEPSGRVVASDISKKRIFQLREILRHSGFKPEIAVADAGVTSPFRAYFDTVVVDVPCSGLGTLRRNPEIKWRLRAEDLARFQKIQSSIIRSASESVREGGRILYSTCSTEPEENELVIGSFLETHPHFAVERPRDPDGIDAWVSDDGCLRTFPSTRRWDGFFAAVLRRQR